MTSLQIAQYVALLIAVFVALGLSSAVWFRLGKVLGLATQWATNSETLERHSKEIDETEIQVAVNMTEIEVLKSSLAQITELIKEIRSDIGGVRADLGGRIDRLHE